MRLKSIYIVGVGTKQLGVYEEDHMEWIVDVRDYVDSRRIEDIDVGRWDYSHLTLRCSAYDSTWLSLSQVIYVIYNKEQENFVLY